MRARLSVCKLRTVRSTPRDSVVFPLAEVAERALDRFSDPSIVDLDPQSPLPIPFVEDSPEMKEKSRRVYITFGRIQKLGATPGCRACLAFAHKSHSRMRCSA